MQVCMLVELSVKHTNFVLLQTDVIWGSHDRLEVHDCDSQIICYLNKGSGIHGSGRERKDAVSWRYKH